MSRSGYSECENDSQEAQWAYIRWRGAVESAFRGKKGQAFLKELLAALDAMPEKKLISKQLVTDSGEVCAIGSVMVARGIDTKDIDIDDYGYIADILGINSKIVQEIEWENDETWTTDEERFNVIRNWVASKIKD